MMNISNKFGIIRNSFRPIVELSLGVFALLDSGAQIPVWLGTPQELKQAYPNAIYDKYTKARVCGFGGDSPDSPVIIIHELQFVGVDLSVRNVAISLNKSDLGSGIFKMILPFSIFRDGSLNIKFTATSCIKSVTYMNLSDTNIYVCRKIHKTIPNPVGTEKYILAGVHCLTQEEVLVQKLSLEEGDIIE